MRRRVPAACTPAVGPSLPVRTVVCTSGGRFLGNAGHCGPGRRAGSQAPMEAMRTWCRRPAPMTSTRARTRGGRIRKAVRGWSRSSRSWWSPIHAARSGRQSASRRWAEPGRELPAPDCGARRPSEREAQVLDTRLVLHADHTMNASTFAARVCAATLSDMHSAVVAAIGTLKGPLHGGANEQVMRTLTEIRSAAPGDPVGAVEREVARASRQARRSWGSATGCTRPRTRGPPTCGPCRGNWRRSPATTPSTGCRGGWRRSSWRGRACAQRRLLRRHRLPLPGDSD